MMCSFSGVKVLWSGPVLNWPPKTSELGNMKAALTSFIKRLIYVLQYVIYELTYYLIGGEAIIHDLVYRSKNKCVPEDKTGSIAIVTGGARGIGASVVEKLLQCNMTVIICCRNPDAAEKVIKKIRESGVHGGFTSVYKLDLLDLNSVKTCADSIKKDYPFINILVNNAGIMFPPYTETKEGFESQWGVNYIGPFLFTHLLLPHLEKAPGPSRGRIVNVTSCAHTAAKPIEFDNINMKNYFISSKAYAQSKLAQILFTIRLEQLLRVKNTPVHVLSVHPGVVNTDIFDGTALKIIFPWVLEYLCKSADQGATTILHACISKDLESSGGLYLSNCTIQQPSKLALDPTLQNDLFAYTLKALQITEFGKA